MAKISIKQYLDKVNKKRIKKGERPFTRAWVYLDSTKRKIGATKNEHGYWVVEEDADYKKRVKFCPVCKNELTCKKCGR